MGNSEDQNFFEKYITNLIRPQEFFAKVKTREAKLADTVKRFLIVAIVANLLVGLISRQATGGIVSFFIVPLVAQMVLVLVLAAISLALGKIFFKPKGNYLDTLQIYLFYISVVLAFTGMAALAGILLGNPLLHLYVLLPALLYFSSILTEGLSIVHDISGLEALAMGLLVTGLVLIGVIAVWAYAIYLQLR